MRKYNNKRNKVEKISVKLNWTDMIEETNLLIYSGFLLLFGSAISIILLISISSVSKVATAQDSNIRIKLAKSIKIERGDTLWDIARENITDEYKNVNLYIEEIMKSNNLSSDTIHADKYIIIPYYTDGPIH